VSPEPGTLYIVATPIGALDDLAPRARDTLDRVEIVLAEDTRRAGKLLALVGVASRGRLRSFHEHNETQRLPEALDILVAGGSVALVSDAGTPVLSDPGFVLVREARRRRVPVASIPGPSSFTAALAASGQPPLPATLVGFLPARAGARRRRIAEIAGVDWTLVVLLSPHRLAAELADLAVGLGSDRPATLLAELSKLHERAEMATLAELARSDETSRPRGEYVAVIGPPRSTEAQRPVDRSLIRSAYREATARGLSRSAAIKTVAADLEVGRREVFDALVRDSADDR
jgi:16S rRNA (cytidine1402-2'-O)-methyltransferase